MLCSRWFLLLRVPPHLPRSTLFDRVSSIALGNLHPGTLLEAAELAAALRPVARLTFALGVQLSTICSFAFAFALPSTVPGNVSRRSTCTASHDSPDFVHVLSVFVVLLVNIDRSFLVNIHRS